MKWRYLAENLYKSRIVNPIVPVSSVGEALDEYEILCESAPKYDMGWVFVDFDSTDTSKRDLIFFHRKKDKTIYYYRKNRDLLNNGAKSVRHEDWATIQMNDVSEWINSLSRNIEDFWYIEQKYDKDNDIMVYWWKINIFWVISNVADTKLTIPVTSDGKFYVFFDYWDRLFHIYPEAELPAHTWVALAEAVVVDWAISSINDVRAAQLSDSFSSTMFDIDNGNIVIKDWAISINKLDDNLKAQINKSHIHTNKEVIDKFIVKDWVLWWGDKNFEALWEANTGSNVGTGFGIFKDKYWVDLRFKTITGSNWISIVQQWDTLNIVGWMVTETQTDVFTGNWVQTVFTASKEVYNNWLIWITTIWGTTLVYNVDYTVWNDRQTITFVQPPVGNFFVNYITRSELWLQTAWEANTASNDVNQTWFWLFQQKLGIDLVFNRLKAWDNVSLSQAADWSITISSTWGGWWGSWVSTRAICWIPEWAIDWINRAFSLPQEPISNDSLLIFKNGLLQRYTTDYTASWYTINFVEAPIVWDELAYEMYTEITEMVARTAITAEHSTIDSDWESIPYAELLWTPKAWSMRVWVNWIFMLETKDYKIVDNKIYIKNVLIGDEIQLLYFYSLS